MTSVLEREENSTANGAVNGIRLDTFPLTPRMRHVSTLTTALLHCTEDSSQCIKARRNKRHLDWKEIHLSLFEETRLSSRKPSGIYKKGNKIVILAWLEDIRSMYKVLWDFPGSSVVKTWSSHCRGTKIPHAA